MGPFLLSFSSKRTPILQQKSEKCEEVQDQFVKHASA